MEEKDINLEETAQKDETAEAKTADTETAECAEQEKTKEEPKKKKKKSTKELEIALEKAEEKAADFQDKYQRLLAEFENARNRNQKESARMYQVGAKEVLEKLLPVIDNFERGLAMLSEEEKEEPFAQGIDKIYKQFITMMTDAGVTAMEAEGKEFNPEFHNAVMHVEDDDYEDNVVVEELQKGYMYKDMVLRHSMVKVAN